MYYIYLLYYGNGVNHFCFSFLLFVTSVRRLPITFIGYLNHVIYLNHLKIFCIHNPEFWLNNKVVWVPSTTTRTTVKVTNGQNGVGLKVLPFWRICSRDSDFPSRAHLPFMIVSQELDIRRGWRFLRETVRRGNCDKTEALRLSRSSLLRIMTWLRSKLLIVNGQSTFKLLFEGSVLLLDFHPFTFSLELVHRFILFIKRVNQDRQVKRKPPLTVTTVKT